MVQATVETTKAMSIGRRCRELMLQELRQQVEQSSTLLITTFVNVKALQLEDLRRKLQLAKAQYVVVKRSLAQLALAAIDLPAATDGCVDTMAFILTSGDPSAVSKVAMDFSKAVPAFRVNAGVMERRYLPFEVVKALADLPPKPVLLAKVCGGMKAPIGRLVGVLSGSIQRLTLVLQAIRDKKGTSASSS